MARLFSPQADTIARLVIIGVIMCPLLLWGLAHALSGSDYATGRNTALPQPVPFSHEHHVGEMGIQCQFCHASVETNAVAGAPSLHVCMTCHSQLWTGAPVLAPLREAAARNQPLAWRRVTRLPDYVYFDHHVHLANGIGCAECHGDVAHMPLTRQAMPMTMAWCVACHRDPGAHMRARDALTDTEWLAHNSDAEAQAYLRAYLIGDTRRLTDCSTCHR